MFWECSIQRQKKPENAFKFVKENQIEGHLLVRMDGSIL